MGKALSLGDRVPLVETVLLPRHICPFTASTITKCNQNYHSTIYQSATTALTYDNSFQAIICFQFAFIISVVLQVIPHQLPKS